METKPDTVARQIDSDSTSQTFGHDRTAINTGAAFVFTTVLFCGIHGVATVMLRSFLHKYSEGLNIGASMSLQGSLLLRIPLAALPVYFYRWLTGNRRLSLWLIVAWGIVPTVFAYWDARVAV